MKIGLLTTSFPRDDDDLAGSFVLGFARALVSRGHSVEVLAPQPHDALLRGGPPAWPGIDVRWVAYLPAPFARTFYGAGVPDNLRLDARAWLGLVPFPLALAYAARSRVHAWDAVVSHWALPSALVAGAVRGTRPHLAVLHSADVHTLVRLPLRRFLARRVSRSADAMLFASVALRDAFLSCLHGGERADAATRAHVSPMGVDPFVASGEPRRGLRSRLEVSGFTALSLGRLVPVKGIDGAVRAIGDVDGAELVVAGEGPERDVLEEGARAAQARVRFVGVVRGEVKRDWLTAADAFVLPSRRLPSGRTEGTPTALLEAMSAGVPVVASDVGGVPGVVTHERTGLLVPPGDDRALAAALTRLATDAALRRRLGRNARATAKHYSWDALAPNLEALLTGSPA